MNNPFRQIGIEIEGGWLNTERVREYFKDDYSVEIPNFVRSGMVSPTPDCVYTYASGEVASPPCDTLEELFAFVDKAHPDAVNESCGIHIHTSFNTLDEYAKVMTPHFYDMLLLRMESFGLKELGEDGAKDAFWKRMRGELKWIQKGFYYADDLEKAKKNLQMNYGAFRSNNLGKRKHQTFEFRILPSFEKSITTLKGVHAYLNVLGEVLNTNPPPTEQFEFSAHLLQNMAPEKFVDAVLFSS